MQQRRSNGLVVLKNTGKGITYDAFVNRSPAQLPALPEQFELHTQGNPFLSLPEDLLKVIMQLLPLHDKESLAQVCRRLAQIANNLRCRIPYASETVVELTTLREAVQQEQRLLQRKHQAESEISSNKKVECAVVQPGHTCVACGVAVGCCLCPFIVCTAGPSLGIPAWLAAVSPLVTTAIAVPASFFFCCKSDEAEDKVRSGHNILRETTKEISLIEKANSPDELTPLIMKK